MDDYVINPLTNKPIMYNGRLYRQLLKKKVIQPKNRSAFNVSNILEKLVYEQMHETIDDEDDGNGDGWGDTEEKHNLNIDLQELFNNLNKLN